MTDISKIVGQRIRSRRQELGLTQEMLAERADLHPNYIGKIERGEINVTVVSLGKMLEGLQLTYSDFLWESVR